MIHCLSKADVILSLYPDLSYLLKIVNVHEAKTHFSRLLKRAHEGEVILLAKAGEPYARLVPLEESQPWVPGIADGRIDEAFFEPLPESDLKAWNQ
ncbi:MAG: type II toxin-antitoxin system prevent-host-death family antitoxin [Desulfobacterales bacterium]|jgi:prevent-host-death family protein